ncbi:hypothetical protein CFBP4996_26415 (plasmid) [Agrobacterium leguminum]|uniref:hypothetical protein n=1 Tax=Agrobacterium leguminum TaxID=2792015 RepID=UPI0010C94F6E|nr:hypothetical protein [Agrobacterium leguminum]WFS69529.1 hypothetical protein CFBP4996_26415 [Agrobacterium leguminum]
MIPFPSPPAGIAPGRLLILACSATKKVEPAYMPAIYRYDGPLWQTLRVTDPRGSMARVAFLSAHYGFRDSAVPIENYNARLTDDLAKRMIAGGMGTRWPRPPSPRRPDTYGMHPGCEIASLSRYGGAPFHDIAFVGGHLYIEVMRAFLPGFIRLKGVVENPTVTEINGPIGVMRRDLRGWLQRGAPSSAS